MWDPTKSDKMKEFDKTLDKAREASIELSNWDNNLTTPNNFNEKTVKEQQELNRDLNNAVEKRVELLGKSVENGLPWGTSMISTAESQGFEREEPVLKTEKAQEAKLEEGEE